MSLVYYVGDAGPITTNVTDELGQLITPQSATATVVNLHTGATVATDENAVVGEGTASWIMSAGSDASQNVGSYVAYIKVVVDASNINTVAIPFDVLDRASYLAVDRWRRKVEFSAPNDDAISDEEGRDWIDQAVAHLNAFHFDTGYTSTLGAIAPRDASIDPAAADQVEMFASVASLMARTAWWAGKGNWRDEEMSLDTSPFAAEWRSLRESLAGGEDGGWYAPGLNPYDQWSMYNRDKTNVYGFADRPDNYHEQTWAGE